MFSLLLGWQRRTLFLILGMTRRHARLVATIVVFTIIAGVLEGGSMGALLLVARILTAGSGLEELQEFGRLGQFLQDFSGTDDVDSLVFRLVFVIVLGQLLKSCSAYLAKRATVNLKMFLRQDAEERVIQNIMALQYEDVMKYPSGELSMYVSTSVTVGRMVVAVTGLMFDIVMLVAYMTVMIIISTKITFLVLVSLGSLSWVFTIVVKKIHRLSDREIDASIEESALSIEMLNNPRALRVLGATQQAAADISDQRNKVLDLNRAREIINLMVAPIADFVVLLGAAIILLAAHYFSGGPDSQALTQAVMFIVILSRMFPRVQGLNLFRLAVATSGPQFKKIAPFLEDIPTARDNQEELRDKSSIPDIKFEDVWFRYIDAEKDTVKEVSFRIPSGTTIAFVGLSGAGKSTIADLIMGLLEPSKGQVLIDNHPLSRINQHLWRDKVGVVDQTSGLLNMSIGDNVIYPLKSATEDSIIAACEAANIHEFISGLIDGYSTVVGESGYRLSAGQKQRLILARALFRKPLILILDEATNALDASSEEMINESVERLHGKCTVIVITHQLRLVKRLDQILFLENGGIIAQGKFDYLSKTSRGFKELWDKQSGQRIYD